MTNSRIQTARLVLRPLRREDDEELHRLWNDPQVRRYLWDDRPVSRETVAAQIELSLRSFQERGFGYFAISPSGDENRLIGFVGLRLNDDSGEVELYFALLPTYWGRGLATEAARAVLKFGFEDIGLAEIVAGADPPNTASFGVMKRLGMSFARDARAGDLPVRYYRIRREAFIAGSMR